MTRPDPTAPRRAALRRLAPLLLVLAAGAALAQPGAVVSLEPSGTLSPQEVDARTAGRFRNNGETPPSARYTVDTYLLRYESTWPEGATLPEEAGEGGGPTEALAQLFVPRSGGGETPLFAFAPGSTGLVEACAPSRSFVDAGSYDTYNAYTLAYAGQGFVSVMPNYLGFFDVGTLQPYYVRSAEAHAVLDALRAAIAALARLDTGIEVGSAFAGGFSQGGHAAFATADLWADYAPDVPLRGVLGFGAATGLRALFLEFTYVAPWVLYSYDTFFPDRIDPAALLAEPYGARLVPDAEGLCVAGVQGYYPSDAERLFVPDLARALREGTLHRDYPELAALFDANDAGLAGHGLPALMLQGVDDPVVTLATQDAFVRRLCEDGSAVRYPNYLRTRHETRYIGFPEANAWMRARAAGEPAPSDCGLLE